MRNLQRAGINGRYVPCSCVLFVSRGVFAIWCDVLQNHYVSCNDCKLLLRDGLDIVWQQLFANHFNGSNIF